MIDISMIDYIFQIGLERQEEFEGRWLNRSLKNSLEWKGPGFIPA
jgi:hypothetical protein